MREHFPFFAANPNLVYMDSAATTLKPQVVIDALVAYNARESVNVHRGVYQLSQKATDTVETVRAQVADWVSTAPERTAIFTKGTTESLNLVAHVLTSRKSQLKDFFPAFSESKPPAIVLSHSEHHANIVPWQMVAAEHGYTLLYIPVDADGNLQDAEKFLIESTNKYSVRIISLSLQSNVTGIVHNLAPLRDWAKKNGSAFVIDAAQAVLHVPVRLRELAPDFVVFSAHKIFGSTGVGAVVASKKVLDACDVYQGGGGMISRVDEQTSTYIDAPAKFEAGTQPIGEIYAFGQALEFAAAHKTALTAIEADLLQYADEKLNAIGVRVFGMSGRERSPIYSFEISGVHAHDTGTLLDEQQVCVRAGHHCCQLLMRAFGVSATARASFSVYNTREDVDKLIQGIAYVKKIFRK